MKLQYSPQAVADLQRLYEFLALKNPIAAKRAALDIQEAAQKLKAFPRIGLPVSKAPNPEQIRDLYVSHYTLRYYLADTETIQVLRIWHNKEVEKDV